MPEGVPLPVTRLERLRALLARGGVRLLLIELLIVFLGVYGAFALQSYSEQREIDAEREKVLVGIKEDLEYFRIFFPGFTARQLIEERQSLIDEDSYRDYSDWRFLQPQYDYTAIEYALNAGVDVVDYELNAGLAGLYQELQKLRHAEELITELAMAYQPISEDDLDEPNVRMAHLANFHGFVLLNDRARDRAEIMERISQLSEEVLEGVDARFAPETLREIELQLIRKRLEDVPDGERAIYIRLIGEAFPDLTEAEILQAIR